MKHVWIIGGSEGIGLAVARELKASGSAVTISARNADRLQQLKELEGFDILTLDATRPDAVEQAVQQIYSDAAPRPDNVLINLGDYEPMSIEEYSLELFERLNAVNYLAPVSLLEHLLPAMKAAGGGNIWVNASLATYRGLPKSAPYSASKAAVVSLVECLVPEAQRWGIHLGVINHGFVRTRLTAKNTFDMPMMIEPEDAASRIIKGMRNKQYEIRFPAMFALWMRLLRIMPAYLYFALTRKMVANDV